MLKQNGNQELEEETLNERSRQILSLLITDYIATADPVGSRHLSRRVEQRLSPATIRNIMADLEEMGYLSQPHISAGRVPTPKGLRYYVDSMVETRSLSEEEKTEIASHYGASGPASGKDVLSILRHTGKVLSQISRYAGLVLMPKWEKTVFRHIEFLPLSRGRLLGIFVSQNGMVENRILETAHDFNYSELEKINNYCNARFVGLTLEEARKKTAEELAKTHREYDKLLAQALLLSQELLEGIEPADLVMEGETRLAGGPEFATLDRVRELMHSLDENQQILKLLDSCLESSGVRIFIGTESRCEPVRNLSLITATYGEGKNVLGTLGVIGPTSMNYSRLIPMIDFTAKLVTHVLEEKR